MLTLQQADQFQTALEQGALVLTPNHQLAVALHETRGAILREQASSAICPSPAILAIDMWIRKSWEALVVTAGHEKAHWQVLTSAQELLVWHSIISESKDTATLLNPGDCVRAASQAATLMKQHFLSLQAIKTWLGDNWPTPEERLDLNDYLVWYGRYVTLKKEKELLSLSDLVELVSDLVSENRVPVPDTILTYGFTEPPPLYQTLLNKLSVHGRYKQLSLETLQPELTIRQYQGQHHEIQAAAEWADKVLQTSIHAKIGILCTDMTARQEQIVRVFSQYETLKHTADYFRNGTNQQLFINSTLALLDLNRPILNTLELCRLLRSPLIAETEKEHSARAELESRLRRYGEYDISPADLRFLSNQVERDHHCPDLARRLQDFAEIARPLLSRKTSPENCLSVFRQQLVSLGWPGERTLNKAERKALELWQQLLDQFLSVAAFTPLLTLPEAIDCLKELAGNHHYNPQQVTDKVSILSAEEAEHLQFTHLWIMGVNEHLWPREVSPNPLLPFRLQREHKLPGTDKNSHYRFYESLLTTLIGNVSKQIRISYAMLQEDLEARPSPALLAAGLELPKESHNDQHSSQRLSEFSPPVMLLRGSVNAEIMNSPALLPLSESEQPRGGKSLLQNQSQCPFLSFAVHRLDAAELPTPTYGLNPMVLGNLLHAVLENVWKVIGTYKALLALSHDDRNRLAIQCSKQAIDRLSKQHPQLMQRRFRELETERLTELVLHWLETEQEREFDAVEELEEQFVWRYKTLSLSLKADRIDRNLQQKLEVIDYKSGRPFSIKWDDDRPQQPQLMLYLLAVEQKYGEDTVSALLHAYVSAGNFSFQYIDQGESGSIPAKSSRPGPEFDWADIKTLWKQALETLANEFIDGLHSVTPRNRSLCLTCHVKPLCRIELNPAYQTDPDDTDSNGDFS